MSNNWTQVVKMKSEDVTLPIKEEKANTQKVSEFTYNYKDDDAFFLTCSSLEEIAYEVIDYCRGYSPNLLSSRESSYDLTEILSEYVYVHNPYRNQEERSSDDHQTEDDYY